MATPPLKLAVLDDYLKISNHPFSTLPADQVSTTIFTDTIHDEAQLIARLKPFHIISTMRERTHFPASVLTQLPNLKLAIITGARNRTFDTAAATSAGIAVARAIGGRYTRSSDPSAPAPASTATATLTKGPDSTTQHTWALLLALARNVADDDADMKRNGGWQTGLATNLSGATIGLLGLGRLGTAVARIAVLAFGMRVIVWSENLTQEKADAAARQLGLDADLPGGGGKLFAAVSKEELFRTSDVVSVHYVLSERSKGIIGEKELAWMKSSALLVNTSRGPLIDEKALVAALEEGRIRGAALDVYDVEPLPANSPWRSAKWGTEGRGKVVLSPHMGYVDERTMHSWYAEIAEIVRKWLESGEVLDQITA